MSRALVPQRNFHLYQIVIYESRKILLTFELCDDFARVYLELNCSFHQTWVILEHLLMSFENEVLLDEVAHVVEAGCSDVTTGTFERMCQVLHLLVTSLLEWSYNVLHRRVQGHALKITEHHVEDLGLSS